MLSFKSSSQKGSVVLGIIILVFILMLVVLVFVAALGFIKSKFEGPCKWLRVVDSMFSSNFTDNVVCNSIGAGPNGSETGNGDYTPAVKWKCSGKEVDPASIKDAQGNVIDPVKAFDGGPNTVIYQYPDGSYLGYIGGSIAWRGNNPGNIISATKDPGKIGDNGRFAAFQNYTLGFNAIINLLEGKSYNNLTIEDALTKYAPPVENNTTSYITNVIKRINNPNITKDTKLSDLSGDVINKLAEAIKTQEGYKVGEIKDGCIAIAPVQLKASGKKIDFEKEYPGKIPKYRSITGLNFDENFGLALIDAIAEAKTYGINISVYSGSEGSHEPTSNHYKGLAADLAADGKGTSCPRDIPGCDKIITDILASHGIYNDLCNTTFDPIKYPKGDCNHFSITGG